MKMYALILTVNSVILTLFYSMSMISKTSQIVCRTVDMVHVLRVTLYFLGCEFFKDYKESGFNPVNLHFDWSQVQLLVANIYSNCGIYAVNISCSIESAWCQCCLWQGVPNNQYPNIVSFAVNDRR